MLTTKFKQTNQRKVILDYIKNNFTHPCVEEIYTFVRTKLPQISKKTVYSNLKFLCEKKLIQEVNIKGIQRYEPKINSHHHVVCKKCGKIVDFNSKDLFKYVLEESKKIKNFEIQDSNITFYGICKDCLEVDKNGK